MKPKRKYLPPHSNEAWPITSHGEVKKPVIITAIVVFSLVVLTLLLFFTDQFVGQAFQAQQNEIGFFPTKQQISSGNPFTVEIQADTGGKKTVALQLSFNLPAGITCNDITKMDSNLGWGQPPKLTCSSNLVELVDYTLDNSLSKGSKAFTIATFTFSNTVKQGDYLFKLLPNNIEIIDFNDHKPIEMAPILFKEGIVEVSPSSVPGKMGSQCQTNANCNAGLECLGNVCVDPSTVLCPKEATGAYPNCLCPTASTFDPKTNLCGPLQCIDKDNDGVCQIELNPPPAGKKPGNDCNDNDPTVYVGAKEICDGKDNNCNGNTDDNACSSGEICQKNVQNQYQCVKQNPGSLNTICQTNANCNAGLVCTNNVCSNPVQRQTKSVTSTKILIEDLQPTTQGGRTILRTKITALDNIPDFTLIIQLLDSVVAGKTTLYTSQSVGKMNKGQTKEIWTPADSLPIKKSVIVYEPTNTLGVSALITDHK